MFALLARIPQSRRGGAVRATLVPLLLFATIVQSCLLATHNHAPLRPPAAASAQQQADKAPPPTRRSPLPVDNCPLCQEAASAGHYLPVLPAVLAQPGPIVAWYSQSDIGQILDRQRSHDWRSRAPPTLLHA